MRIVLGLCATRAQLAAPMSAPMPFRPAHVLSVRDGTRTSPRSP